MAGFAAGTGLSAPAGRGECGCCYILTQTFDRFSHPVNISCAQRLIHSRLLLVTADICPFTFCCWEPSYALQSCSSSRQQLLAPWSSDNPNISRNCCFPHMAQLTGLMIGYEPSIYYVGQGALHMKSHPWSHGQDCINIGVPRSNTHSSYHATLHAVAFTGSRWGACTVYKQSHRLS